LEGPPSPNLTEVLPAVETASLNTPTMVKGLSPMDFAAVEASIGDNKVSGNASKDGKIPIAVAGSAPAAVSTTCDQSSSLGAYGGATTIPATRVVGETRSG